MSATTKKRHAWSAWPRTPRLTSSSLGSTTTAYSYDADGQRLTAQIGSTTAASASWNGADELNSYSDAAASMTSASYDAGSLRQSDTITPAGGGSSSQSFVWDTVNNHLLMDSGNAYIYTTGTAPSEQVNLATGAVTYLAADSLGSVRGVVDQSGSLTATTSYDAWGNPQTPGGLTSHTPFGYAGGYTDPTGLIYLINRYYDPATGQFISVDPDVGQTGQPYAYTGGDPVNATDPLGLYFREVECNCAFSDEAAFETLLYRFLKITQVLTGGFIQVDRQAGMKLPTGNPKSPWRQRYTDIYFHMNSDFPGRYGFGVTNELKVGAVHWNGRTPRQAAWDRDAMRRHTAIPTGSGKTKWTNMKAIPVSFSVWWDAPDFSLASGFDTTTQQKLNEYGILMLQINFDPNAPIWPRKQSKQKSKKEAEEIESGDVDEAGQGADAMFHPCPAVCKVKF
jgi:RHS repeat-associated protein